MPNTNKNLLTEAFKRLEELEAREARRREYRAAYMRAWRARKKKEANDE